MKKGMITLLCIAGMILCGVATASAQVTWTMLETSAAGVLGVNPGADYVFRAGGDDSADNCNFNTVTGCATGTPTVGSYSFNAVDFKPDPREECYSGLVTGGTPCKCNDGSTTCHPGADTCPAIPGQCGDTPGDCCGFLPCQTCNDAISYFGSGGSAGNTGTLVTTMGASDFTATVFDVATAELIGGSGGGCLALDPASIGDDTGAPRPVNGTQTPVSGRLDVDVSVGGCSVPGTFQVPNVNYVGNIFPASGPPTAVCGYTTANGALASLIADATAAAGTSTNLSIIVLCGNTFLPATGGVSSLPCYSNASVDFVTVGWTTQTW